MSPRYRSLLAAAVIAALGAGGLSLASAAAPEEFPDVTAMFPAPSSDLGQSVAAEIARYSTAYPSRATGSPILTLAGNDISAAANAIGGYTVQTLDLPLQASSTTTVPSAPTKTVQAIVATKAGTGPHADENIVLGGHFDGWPQSGPAAYDNASGPMLLLGLMKAFKDIPTDRTIVFTFYTGEEQGAYGSAALAKMWKDSGKKVRVYEGFDMVGIAWPVANPVSGTTCLCMWHGPRPGDTDFKAVLKHAAFDLLGLPDEKGKVEVVGLNDRNSDERSWANYYPTMRFAGMRKAASYPQYHMPQDNMTTIDTAAGSRANFEAGLQNTLEVAYWTTLLIDNAQA